MLTGGSETILLRCDMRNVRNILGFQSDGTGIGGDGISRKEVAVSNVAAGVQYNGGRISE